MSTHSENEEPDKVEDRPGFMASQETYEAWITEDPRNAEALMDVVRRLLEEKQDGMHPEQVEEIKALTRQLGDEIADNVVPLHYNPLADRLREFIDQKTLSDEDVEELHAMDREFNRLLDMALDLVEPRRTEVITTMTASREQLRLMLNNLVDVETDE